MSEHSDQSESSQNPWEDRNSWIRILYMLLFGFIFWFCHFIVFAFAIIETIHRLITGESCSPLQSASRRLGLYVKQLADFLMYNNEQHPFPLSDFPAENNTQHATDSDEVAAESTENSADEVSPPRAQLSTRKKTSRKKKLSAKKSASKRAKNDDDNDASEDTATDADSASTNSEQ